MEKLNSVTHKSIKKRLVVTRPVNVTERGDCAVCTVPCTVLRTPTALPRRLHSHLLEVL